MPLSNYLGWYFTVYLFLQLFALYLRAAAPDPEAPAAEGLVLPGDRHVRDLALAFVLDYAVGKPNTPVTDATGKIWQTADIYETAAIIEPPHHGLRRGGNVR